MSFIHSFTQTFKTYIKYLLYARHYTRYLGCIHEENGQISLILCTLYPTNTDGEGGHEITKNIINI